MRAALYTNDPFGRRKYRLVRHRGSWQMKLIEDPCPGRIPELRYTDLHLDAGRGGFTREQAERHARAYGFRRLDTNGGQK